MMFRIKFILLPMMIIVFAECASGPRIVIKKSIEELQKAVDNDPNDHFAHYNIGIGYTIKKDYEQALNAFRRTLEINPHFAEAYFAIYCVEYEKDSKLYAESLKEQPSSEMEGKIQEIGNYLKSAFMYNPFFDWKLSTILLEKRPTSPYPYIQELIDAVYNLVFDGFRQFSLGNYKNAVKKFEFIIENFPEFIQARLFRGLAYAQLNNYDSAISDFQFVIDKLEEYNKKKILPIYLNPFEAYKKGFFLTNEMVDDFIQKAANASLDTSTFRENMDYLKILLKAEIAKICWGKKESLIIGLDNDCQLQIALEYVPKAKEILKH